MQDPSCKELNTIVAEKKKLETCSTCYQHVKCTCMNSPEFHTFIFYMGGYPLTCWGHATHVQTMKKNSNNFSTCGQCTMFCGISHTIAAVPPPPLSY